jgi:putative membrane protein
MQMDILTIPVSMVIVFVFAVIGKVGEVNEDPFENKITDVPMTAIANTIERDLKTMLGMKDIPSLHAPKDGYLY